MLDHIAKPIGSHRSPYTAGRLRGSPFLRAGLAWPAGDGQANECIAAHTMSPVKARIARALLQVAEILGQRTAGGIAVPDAIRQRDIAAMAGVARETVNRVLHEWEHNKVVTKVGHSYLIADIRALEREVTGEFQ